MKKILFLLLAVPALVFTGCKDDEESVEALEVLTSDIDFDAPGGTGTITLKTSGLPVKAASDKEWLTIDNADASTVAYTVAGYDGPLGRTAQITITSGSLSRSVTVLQKGALAEISGDPVEIDPAGLEASEIAFSVSASTLPTVTVPEDAAWLHATVEEDKIVLTGDFNLGEPRSTTISVSQAWKPAVEIQVSQKTIALLKAETIETVKADAKEVTIEVSEYMEQVAPDWEVNADVAWITLAKTAGAVTVSLSENDTKATRTGNITVTGAGKTLYTIPVEQGPVNYDFFLGKWDMPHTGFNDAGDALTDKTATMTIQELPEDTENGIPSKTFYIIGQWWVATTIAQYVDGDVPHLALTSQYLGSASSLYLYFCPIVGTSITWASGAGMNFVYTDDNTLTAEDNGVRGNVSGFQIAAFNSKTPSGSAYQGPFEIFDDISTLTRAE